METSEAIAIGRYFWPRLFAVLLFVGLVFFQKPIFGLIEAEVKHRAREYTALLTEAVFPDAKPQGDKRAARHRANLTGAPAGARQRHQNKAAQP